MDIAVKKIELIEWLARLQDESLIQKIELLRKGAIKESYEQRMSEAGQDMATKLDRSEKDINEDRTHTQQEVEDFFKKKFNK